MSYKVSGFWQRIKWMTKGMTTVVLKTDNFEEEIEFLKLMKIKYYIHVDAGKTSVAPGSECMVTFFAKDEPSYLDELKLY